MSSEKFLPPAGASAVIQALQMMLHMPVVQVLKLVPFAGSVRAGSVTIVLRVLFLPTVFERISKILLLSSTIDSRKNAFTLYGKKPVKCEEEL